MKGTNILELNTATIVEAVQHWLGSKTTGEFAAATVTSVEFVKEYGSSGSYRVTLSSPE